jgi:hypothetical protein
MYIHIFVNLLDIQVSIKNSLIIHFCIFKNSVLILLPNMETYMETYGAAIIIRLVKLKFTVLVTTKI